MTVAQNPRPAEKCVKIENFMIKTFFKGMTEFKLIFFVTNK